MTQQGLLMNLKDKKRICCIVGTRPEIIKMFPIIQTLRQKSWADVIVLNTAQHKELIDPIYSLFNIKPDIDLDIMRPNQTIPELTSNLILSLSKNLLEIKPDIIIGQGDTTTVFTAALVSFYYKIPFAHVEAGLRTYERYHPFPEEINRTLTTCLASLHFAPTDKAKDNLLKENILESTIHVTGNTIVDAVFSLSNQNSPLPFTLNPSKRYILVTAHRRENLGEPLRNICEALIAIVKKNTNVEVIFPLHANPEIHKIVYPYLAKCDHIVICPPLVYDKFITMLKASYLILTDSGGIQEEAAILGKPTLVLRQTTERHEAIKLGVTRLVGTQPENIINTTQELLDNPALYKKMCRHVALYGNGQAAKNITNIIEDFLFLKNS